MIRLWDFQCESCGKLWRDWPVTAKTVPASIRCSDCEGKATWARQRSRGQIHRSLSTMYNGKVDPRTGEVYESYEDKQKKLKAHGLVEGDIERLDDIMADGPEDTGPRDPNVQNVDANSDEEAHEQILKKLQTDPRVDRKNTGTPRERMLDSWFEL